MQILHRNSCSAAGGVEEEEEKGEREKEVMEGEEFVRIIT